MQLIPLMLASLLVEIGAPSAALPPREFIERIHQADQVVICVFRDKIPSMARSGFDPELLRRFRAHGCVPVEKEMWAQLEEVLADPRSWRSPVLPKGDVPDPVHTRFAFRFMRGAEQIEVRYLPETGRLEALMSGRKVAQGYCGEQGGLMNLVKRSFPADREIARLGPGYQIDPHRWLGPCGPSEEAHVPAAWVLDLFAHSDTAWITRLPQDGAIHADMNGTLPRFVREWPAKNWVRVSRSWQIEAGSLLADSSTWRGTHDVDWEISRPENSTFAIRGRRHGQVVHFVLFLDMQCIQASGGGSPTVHGHCGTVRYLLPLVKKAFPFDPQVQSLEYGGPEAVE